MEFCGTTKSKQASMIERVQKHIQCNVFTPAKILKAIDLSGFQLILTGLVVLRHVYTMAKYSPGFLPSKAQIMRCAHHLEQYAKDYCPFKMIGRIFNNDSGDDADYDYTFVEGFEFGAIKATTTLFDAFGLTDETKWCSVELGLACDGAKLTQEHISHVAVGLKFNDVAMCHPLTELPLLLHQPDSLVQSHNICFALRNVIAKDSKKTLDEFQPLYDMFNSGKVSEAQSAHPIKISFQGDVKLQWGALDDGGTTKVKKAFCYICSC